MQELQRVQLMFFVIPIILSCLQSISITVNAIQTFFLIVALGIKLWVLNKKQKIKQALKAQVTFYIAYLLTGVTIVFFYQTVQAYVDFVVLNNILMVNFILKNVYFSFHTCPEITSLSEMIVSSVAIVIQIILQVSATISDIKFYDRYYDNQYQKDFTLLTTTSTITLGTVILDLIFRTYEKQQKIK